LLFKNPKAKTLLLFRIYQILRISTRILKGNYIDDFAGSNIRIAIIFISNKQIIGYDVLKGLVRNLSGDVSADEKTLLLNVEDTEQKF
jgi:hypothetical protein